MAADPLLAGGVLDAAGHLEKINQNAFFKKIKFCESDEFLLLDVFQSVNIFSKLWGRFHYYENVRWVFFNQ